MLGLPSVGLPSVGQTSAGLNSAGLTSVGPTIVGLTSVGLAPQIEKSRQVYAHVLDRPPAMPMQSPYRARRVHEHHRQRVETSVGLTRAGLTSVGPTSAGLNSADLTRAVHAHVLDMFPGDAKANPV